MSAITDEERAPDEEREADERAADDAPEPASAVAESEPAAESAETEPASAVAESEPAAESAETELSAAALAERRYGFLAAVAVMVLVLGFVLGGKLVQRLLPRPSEQQCAQLLERYIEHKSRQRYPDVTDEAIVRAQRTIPTGTKRADLHNCQHELSAAQVSCGLRAPNIDEMERCLQ